MSGSQRDAQQGQGDEEQQNDDQYHHGDEQSQQNPNSTGRPVYGSPSPPPSHPYTGLQEQHQYPPTAPPTTMVDVPPLYDENGSFNYPPKPTGVPPPNPTYSPLRYPMQPGYQPSPTRPSCHLPHAAPPIDPSLSVQTQPVPPGHNQATARPNFMFPPDSSQFMQHAYGVGPQSAHQGNVFTAPIAPIVPSGLPGQPPRQPSSSHRRRERIRVLDDMLRDLDDNLGQESEPEIDTGYAEPEGADRGCIKRNRQRKPTEPDDQHEHGQESEAEMDADADRSKSKRRKKPLRPLEGRDEDNPTDDDVRKKGGGQWCKQPKKSQRRPAVGYKASEKDQVLHGASIHLDKHGKRKRGPSKHISWALPRRDALLEASGLFSDTGEPCLTRRDIVDRQVRETSGAEGDDGEWLRQARNTWSKALSLALKEFWERHQNLSDAQQKAKDAFIADRAGHKSTMDDWAPRGRLRLCLTEAERRERDEAFQQAQNLAASGDTSVLARFPQLAPLPGHVDPFVAAAAPAPCTQSTRAGRSAGARRTARPTRDIRPLLSSPPAEESDNVAEDKDD